MSSRRRQLPGRTEALRLVLQQGVGSSSPELRHLAGMNRQHSPQPSRPLHGAVTFSSGIEQLPPQERAALPF